MRRSWWWLAPGTRAASLRELVEEMRQRKGELLLRLGLQRLGQPPRRGAALPDGGGGGAARPLSRRRSRPDRGGGRQRRFHDHNLALGHGITGRQPVARTGGDGPPPRGHASRGANRGGGGRMPEYHATAWYGIVVPRGTPAASSSTEAIQTSLTAPEMAERLREEGAEPARMDGEAFGRAQHGMSASAGPSGTARRASPRTEAAAATPWPVGDGPAKPRTNLDRKGTGGRRCSTATPPSHAEFSQILATLAGTALLSAPAVHAQSLTNPLIFPSLVPAPRARVL